MLNLFDISETEYAIMDLFRDPLFKCLNPDEVINLANRSRELGVKRSDIFEAVDIIDLLKNEKVDLIYDVKRKVTENCKYHVFSEMIYGVENKKIILYVNEIKAKHDSLVNFGADISLEELIQFHIAHEFYHYQDYFNGEMTYKNIGEIYIKKAFFVKIKRYIKMCDEIAAQSFTKSFLKSNIVPQATDYIFYVDRGLLSMNEIEDRLRRVKQYV